MNDVTIIIITYKSQNVIYDFIKKIPSSIKTIIVENSQNHELKKKIEQNYKNIAVLIKENNGVSSALNFAVEKIETKYFLQISPDVQFNYEKLEVFLNYAEKINDTFAALGPRFLNVKEKSHKQIDGKLESGEIDSIHGSCMFINKENFKTIGKFDEKFFLYFEETEYCFRAKKKGYKSYQINLIEVETKGRSVETNKGNDQKFNNILIWHFIWSKYYYNKSKYGKILSILIFTPLIIRIIVRLIFYKILKDKKNFEKYKFRLNGLISSVIGRKSSLRP
jgi:N-acetylglucosaminyl-diphospho-decaprenol L-rhamnosyltransferase